VDLAELAGDAVHDARAVQPDRPVSLLLDPSLTDAPVVTGDEARLRQVIGNLVTNALTHTPVEARVTVRLAEDEADPGVVVLAVSDEGPGISDEEKVTIFNKYEAAKNYAMRRDRPGRGLGLTFTKLALTRTRAGSSWKVQWAAGPPSLLTSHEPRRFSQRFHKDFTKHPRTEC